MNRVVYIAVLAIAIFAGCKKDNSATSSATSSSPYYLRFKSDGVLIEYKDSSYSKPEMGDVPGVNTGYFSCWKANSGVNRNMFSIRVYGTDAVNTGSTYTEAIFSPTGTPSTTGFWYDESGVLYANMNTISAAYSTEVQPFQTKITELTSTTIKGTFSGKLMDYKTSTVHIISEGEFFLLRD